MTVFIFVEKIAAAFVRQWLSSIERAPVSLDRARSLIRAQTALQSSEISQKTSRRVIKRRRELPARSERDPDVNGFRAISRNLAHHNSLATKASRDSCVSSRLTASLMMLRRSPHPFLSFLSSHLTPRFPPSICAYVPVVV